MGFSDHFSTQSVVYAEFRPNYPEEIFAWLSSQCKERNFCWDAATGNGQAAEALAGYFARVYASDGSASQIAAARNRPISNTLLRLPNRRGLRQIAAISSPLRRHIIGLTTQSFTPKSREF